MQKPKRAYLLMIGHVGCIPDYREPGTNKGDLIRSAQANLDGDIEPEHLRGMSNQLDKAGIFYPTGPHSTRVIEIAPLSETGIDEWWDDKKGGWLDGD